MNIGLLNIMHTRIWDFRRDLAQSYADALKNAIELQLPNDAEKLEGYFLSKKGVRKEGQLIGAGFQDKLYVGDIQRIERHLYWNGEELQEDDQIINVVVVDGPVTRDGDGCSYGTKDFRDQVMYANTIPQVVGHIFVVNTPGGQSSCRNDYDMMFADCREKGKPTVAFVDGMCCSSGVNLTCRCDRVIVMNPKDEYGCIGSMAAFWAVAHDTVDRDGYRYVELVGDQCPDKNAWWRDAAKGEYEELQKELNKDTEEFHNTVRENRPLVTDDLLTGKVFEAQEVIPQLVDEIGDMERAIECVFELADETLVAARLVTAEPKEEEPGNPGHEEPEELAKLNEQQKAAMATEASKGNLVMADDGHVTKEVQTIFGPATVEVAQPQNQENMIEEKQKAQEAAAAQAAQEAEEQAQQEQASEEEQQAQEEAPAGEQSQEEQNQEEQAAEEQQQEQQAEEGAQEEQQAEEQAPASQEEIENAEAEIDKIQETLHNAEQMIADKDKEIAKLTEDFNQLCEMQATTQNLLAESKKNLEDANGTIAERDKSIAEKDAEIEKLQKQVEDLKAEVKELAGKPAPMTSAAAGVPAGNGTGEAPKQFKPRVTRGMGYHEIREAMKKK